MLVAVMRVAPPAVAFEDEEDMTTQVAAGEGLLFTALVTTAFPDLLIVIPNLSPPPGVGVAAILTGGGPAAAAAADELLELEEEEELDVTNSGTSFFGKIGLLGGTGGGAPLPTLLPLTSTPPPAPGDEEFTPTVRSGGFFGG